MEFLQSIPVIRIFDLPKTREFYLNFLSFSIDWEHRFESQGPVYMQVSRNGLVLHLSEHHGECSPGAKVFVWMNGIREFHSELSSRGYSYNRPQLTETFYGTMCVDVTDPFGNHISFNEKLSPNDSLSQK